MTEKIQVCGNFHQQNAPKIPAHMFIVINIHPDEIQSKIIVPKGPVIIQPGLYPREARLSNPLAVVEIRSVLLVSCLSQKEGRVCMLDTWFGKPRNHNPKFLNSRPYQTMHQFERREPKPKVAGAVSDPKPLT